MRAAVDRSRHLDQGRRLTKAAGRGAGSDEEEDDGEAQRRRKSLKEAAAPIGERGESEASDKEDEESESAEEAESEEEDSDDESFHSAEDGDEAGLFADKGEAVVAAFEAGQSSDGQGSSRGGSWGETAGSRLRPPRRLRFEDMTWSMRRRLGAALHEGGAHFVFGGSRRAHLRRETLRDALLRSAAAADPSGGADGSRGEARAPPPGGAAAAARGWLAAKSRIGTRRVCGEEWLSGSVTGRGSSVGRSSLARASTGRASIGLAFTASLARPGSDLKVSESVARISASIARSDRRGGPAPGGDA